MSSLVWVLTFCLKTSDTFRRMTGEKTLVVIGALGIELHFFRVRISALVAGSLSTGGQWCECG